MTKELKVSDRSIPYVIHEGKGPGIFVCNGLGTNMTEKKTSAILDHYKKLKRYCVGFNYSGHTSGEIKDLARFNISDWVEDSLAAFAATEGKQIVCGSSMGFWMACHIALKYPTRVAGIFGMSPAVDIHRCFPARMSPDQFQQLNEAGWVKIEPDWILTKPNYYAAQKQSLLDRMGILPIKCPVRLIVGRYDTEFSPFEAIALQDRFASDDVVSILIRDGNHVLRRDRDVTFILGQIDDLIKQVESSTEA